MNGQGILLISFVVVAFLFLAGIRIVRPTHRGLIERLGKYSKFARPGFNWIIPVIDQLYQTNVTEIMIDAQPQEIITNDNLNASVDAQVYFKIRDDEDSVKKSQYNVNSVERQIVNLARTTLRNIIGTLTLKSANSERGRINADLHEVLIKEAEGIKRSNILQAEGEAEAIRLVNDAANKYFIGNAQILKKLETVERSLANNAKIVVPADSDLVNVIGNLAGVLPIKKAASGDPS